MSDKQNASASIFKDENLILELMVNVTDVIEVKGFSGTGRLVLFDGTAGGKYFNGIIDKGGADTQKEISGKPGTLSARYILSGTDVENNKCKIFVENNAAFGEECTYPEIFTDSPVLKWLETAELRGKIITDNGKLCIKIYTI